MSQSVKTRFKAHGGGSCHTWYLREWLIKEVLVQSKPWLVSEIQRQVLEGMITSYKCAPRS